MTFSSRILTERPAPQRLYVDVLTMGGAQFLAITPSWPVQDGEWKVIWWHGRRDDRTITFRKTVMAGATFYIDPPGDDYTSVTVWCDDVRQGLVLAGYVDEQTRAGVLEEAPRMAAMVPGHDERIEVGLDVIAGALQSIARKLPPRPVPPLKRGFIGRLGAAWIEFRR